MTSYPSNYKEFYDTLPCGYFSTMPNGKIIESNKRFLEFTGYNQEEVIEKKKLADFLTLGSRIYLETHFFPLLQYQDSVEEVNFDFVKKDGSKFPVLINSIVVKDEEGKPKFIQFTVFNISQRRSYEKELLIAKRDADDLSSQLLLKNEELKDSSKLVLEQKLELENINKDLINKNRQLSDFAHIASHNLRSPVNNLYSLLDFYVESTDLEEKEMLFDTINKVVNQMDETLNELIDSLKVQDTFDKSKDLIDFNDVFEKIKLMISGEIIKTNAIVTSNFSKAGKIMYSKVYMESALLNLLSNAIRYRSPDRTPKIHFETENEADRIIIKVTDNGLGIDMKKHRNELFGLNKSFHNHPDSKGVGLYMTKIQVEAMGGTIAADSEVGIGTTFKIVLRKNL